MNHAKTQTNGYAPGAKSPPRSIVHISRHEAGAFGWKIYRNAGSIEIHRSTRLFATRIEAIVDSARAAATLRIAIIQPSSVYGENRHSD
jgi:hypothetical protein